MRKISFIFIVVAVILVFRNFILSGQLVWGDAPFFYFQNYKSFISLPSAWITRGNTFGGINLFLFIHPIMVLYGILGNYLHLSNDVVLRILFYVPSLIFGFCGTYLFVRYYKYSYTVTFFAVLIYLINTYYLLLIDGGQVGVVLAYGLFPFVLYFIVKAIDKETIINFLITLLLSFILTIIDFRVSAICIFTALVFTKRFKVLVSLSILLIALSSYWIIPVLKLTASSISTDVTSLQTTSLLNALFLFSPNWPSNQFGKTIAPYFYFSLVPILIFLPLFISKNKKHIWLVLYFLVFAFIVKGASGPIGGIYSLFVNTRLGSVMRDSTKFYMPLMLFGGMLIGISVEEIISRLGKRISLIFQGIVFLFFLFLVWQTLLGRMNGVLGKNSDLSSYQRIEEKISSQNGFLRSAWFTEKSPFAFHTEEKQALDAKDLVNFRPFATTNVGTGDRFNFINNTNYLDWFNLMGIRYLVLNGNPRVSTSLSKSDQDDWDRLNKLLVEDKRLKKINIGTSFPVYENTNIHPNTFFIDKAFIVIGGDDIYQKFSVIDKNFSVGNQGFLFVEDGKVDPYSLQNVASTSAVVIFNNETKDDLKMSFLQHNFLKISDSIYSQWAMRKADDYLSWKFELLTKGIDQHSFDYGKGIAFSTVAGEKIDFKINIPEKGDYWLITRTMSASDSAVLEESFNGITDSIDHKNTGVFSWNIKGPIGLNKGDKTLTFKNNGGLQVVNTVALVSVNDMKIADQMTTNFLGTFKHLDVSNSKDISEIKKIIHGSKWESFDRIPSRQGWIVFTDTFNSNWILSKRNEDLNSYPMYSMINSFYYNPEWGDIKIVFKGEDDVRWGIYWSSFTLITVIIIVLWVTSKESHKKR